MSNVTQYTDFSDLYTGLQNATREQTGVTAVENQAKRYINIALQDMHLGFAEKVPWAERTAILTTQQSYTTGTVTISQGSTSLTGASTLWNTNNAFSIANTRVGGKIVINGTSEVYEISAVGSDTGITLTEKYVGSDVSGGSYVYFEDEYALASDFLRPIDIAQFSDGIPIHLISRTEFRKRYVRNKTVGTPTAATLLDKPFSGSTARVRKVRLHKPPNVFMQIPYSYITSELAVSAAGASQVSLSADDDEPIVPLRYRHALLFHALYHWYRDRKDDSRSQEAKGEYTDIMLRLAGDVEIGSPRPKIEVRNSHYKRAARTPYQSRGRSRFDRGRWDELGE